jgi:menaquinone-dependent protoporphyrinogen oxidase
MTLLVAYASRHGATAGIAEFIGSRLADHGIAIEVRRVDCAESLDGYDEIVLGAPVYDQRWPDEASDFAARFAAALAARPLWLFSVGSFGDTQRLVGRVTHKEPKGIDSLLAELRPRDYRVFRGVIEKGQWPFWSRAFFHLLGGRLGDHREWDAIAAWADRIARERERAQSALG